MAQVMRSVRIEGEPVVITYRSAAPLEPVFPPPPEAPREAALAPAVAEDPGATLEALRRQAFEDGYRDGRDSGEKAAQEALAAELKKLQALARSLREAFDQGIAGAEDAMVEIAFAAVCKMLGAAAASEEGVRAMVREALREVRAKEGVVLRVSPRDHAMLHGELGALARLEVVADERIAAGGCLVETGGGTLDARLEVQLRQLLDTLARAREAQGD
jgi:flagellar assembly protein FliH